MGRIAVTDGMADAAVSILESAGHEVVLRHYEVEELRTGVLADFDAVVVRSATKMTSEAIEASCSGGRLGFIKKTKIKINYLIRK